MTTQAKILIVEDEPDIRKMMQFDLSDAGYSVETAADGREGLRKFASGAPWDLVLLDQRIPAMDGLEVLRLMREQDPAVRVIMVTAYATIELAAQAMKDGVAGFFRKPFSFNALRGAVAVALAKPRQQAPSGETRCCAVDVTLYVREVVRSATGRDHEPVHHAWDVICQSALANYLWQQAEISPATLPVYDLTQQQLQVVRSWKN